MLRTRTWLTVACLLILLPGQPAQGISPFGQDPGASVPGPDVVHDLDVLAAISALRSIDPATLRGPEPRYGTFQPPRVRSCS